MTRIWKRLWLTLLAVESCLLVSVLVVDSVVTRRAERAEARGQQRPSPAGETAAASSASSTAPPLGAATARARLDCSSRDQRVDPAPGSPALVYGPWDGGGWTDVYSQAGGRGRRLGQALLGDEVEVLSQEDGWSEVRLPQTTGMPVWLDSAHLTAGSGRVRAAWASSSILFVAAAPGVQVENGPFLPFGSRLATTAGGAGDGGRLWLPDGCAIDFPPPLGLSFTDALPISDALEQAKQFRRVPYEVGANTRRAMDAAGLVFLVFRVAGSSVPRSLEQQLRVGREIPLEAAAQGDVIFLSTFDPERPQPVILLDNGDTYLAASPSIGVALGLVSQMRNRRVLSVRRYV